MKIYIFILLISTNVIAQIQKKDTLYFSYDEKYILFSDFNDTEKFNYKKFEQKVVKNIKWTGTEGYFLLKKLDTLYNLNPKKIHSLKGYVEQRSFYYPGKYSRTVNRKILKENLFNKYVIFIVDDNNFIKIRQHPNENIYNSYYPIKFSDDKIITKPLRDTIFIKFNKNILTRKQDVNGKNYYYLIKNLDQDSETTYFSEQQEYLNIEPTEILNLREIIEKSGAYYGKDKFNDFDLFNYFSKAGYIVFLVKENKCVKVEINSVIE
ncbi:hypothetical protein [Mariniflexile sp. AS56]|uniref:hypothetical protein n=1 Tax=Mariniflexile sp. AS56 TaxID=3063957 RepID=UPI0026EE7357|nr:hypothetical protein [Mariniflexile sp. AS56]MDO7173440.1 hypothetical protein [Mariniflexile sp. AS56]